MIQMIVDWVANHYFETLAAALGFLAIYLQIKQNVWYWLVSIVMVSMYIYIYVKARLYADMSLQVYYLVVSIYGAYLWMFGKTVDDHRTSIAVSRTGKASVPLLTLVSIALFVVISWILIRFTDSDLPYWDSFTTSVSFVATWMLARKKLENWLLWIVVDAVSTGIYIYKGLYPTAVLFCCLTFFAILGYQQWKKSMDFGKEDEH
jgi:nicotinamide mononucleotide transporter